MESEETTSDSPRSVVGKYRVVRPLKIGGTAAIYLALMRGENNFSREVVIKRPLPHLVADTRLRLMFIDEAHIAARLAHPNICQVLDLVARDDELYLVLEYLRGVDLREVLKVCIRSRHFMPPELAVWIGIEVCAGLHFAHEAAGNDGTPLNIVHRDVSPKNIRLTHTGAVKVIDFGIARAMNRETETAAGTVKGTLGYMSPEQILGAEIDRRSDIFAFGICLFQMLTNRNPFDGPNLKERVRRLTHLPVPKVRAFVPSLDRNLEAIVDRCLAREPSDRYPNLQEVESELHQVLRRYETSSMRSQLIAFLETLFPKLHEVDPLLQVALNEKSRPNARIDVAVRLIFPDDAPRGSEGTTTQRDGRTGDTQPDPERLSAQAVQTGDAPVTEVNKTIRARILAVMAVILVAVVALITVEMWPRDPEVIASQSVSTPPASQPDAAREHADAQPAEPPRPAPPPRKIRVPSRKIKSNPPNAPSARRFLKAAIQHQKRRQLENARLLYLLAYAFGTPTPDSAVYLNLGLLYNSSENEAKAKACLRRYLARRPAAPEAERIRTLLASFAPTKSVSCVSRREVAQARRRYSRQGPVIDAMMSDIVPTGE